jgi:agmatinase
MITMVRAMAFTSKSAGVGESEQNDADETRAPVRQGNLYGPDATFVGVPAADLDDPASFAGAAAVVIGAPFDGGTSHRPGCRFGPQAIRFTDYLPHDGRRPHLALGVDPLVDLAVVDVGDVEMPPGDTPLSLERLEGAVESVARSGAVPVILGGDHTIALPDVTGVARHVGWGRVSVIHFDAHADTGDTQLGSLLGHGTPMRRLIESGAARGDRFLQIGLRGYWPGPETLRWMDEQAMRSYEMTEIVERGLAACLTEASAIALDDCDAVFLSVDVDVVDPGSAPGTGTPEPGGGCRPGPCSMPSGAWPWSCPSPVSTWWRWRPPTTRPRSRPIWPTGSSSKPCPAWPGGVADWPGSRCGRPGTPCCRGGADRREDCLP